MKLSREWMDSRDYLVLRRRGLQVQLVDGRVATFAGSVIFRLPISRQR